MFSGLFKFILQQKLLILLAGLVLLIAGIIAWQQIPIDAFPDVTNVQVMILTDAPGLAPIEVERQITFPVEIEMTGLPRVRQMRSLSKAGLSQVVIVFDDDVDIYFARQVVFERLTKIKEDLPPGVEPEMGPVSTGLGEIYQYTVKSGYYCNEHSKEWSGTETKCRHCSKSMTKASYSPMELRTIQNWIIAPQLRKLRGVNEVNSFGGLVKQYHVIPDPNLLIKYEITLEDLSKALEENNANVGGSFLVQGGEQFYIVGKGFFRTPEDIENIVLKSHDGTPIYLKNVLYEDPSIADGSQSKIKLGGEIRKGAVTQDGKGEIVIGMVMMLKDSNSKHVVERVKNEIPKIQRTLPPGIKIVPFYDRTSLITACIDTVSYALFEGVILAIIVLFLMLWDIRASITVAISLPLIAGVTFILMKSFGITANMMSLGGLAIAIGVVVDASIVVTENIARHLSDPDQNNKSRTAVVYEALVEVARPVCFAILIIIITFLPLFTLESMEGKMFKPLATTMCFALFGSLVVALTIVPVFASLFVKRETKKSGENIVVRLILKVYQPLLKKALKHRVITLSILFILFLSIFAIIPFLGTEFLPPLDEGAIAVNIVRLPSASLETSTQQSLELEERLKKKFTEISTIVSKCGRAEISEDPMGPEQTDMFIMLKSYDKWPSDKSKNELIEEIREEMLKSPGIKPAFSQPIALRVNELISGVKSDVALKIFGDDVNELQKIAEQVAPILGQVKGATDIKIEQTSGFSQIEVEVDRTEMARHKINISQINLIIEMAIGGKIVTTFFEKEKRFAVLLRFPKKFRNDKESISRLLVPSPLGFDVPLGKLATIKNVETPAQISREDTQRRLIVECNIQGRDMGSFIDEAKEGLAPMEAELPTGYRFVWGGQFENQIRAKNRLMVVVPISIMLIFLMLFSAFNSLKSALLVIVNLPFALVGGIWAVFLFDINLSVSASIGFIALFGVAAEDGIVLVSFFNQLKEQGLSTYDAVIEGCKKRVRPVIMTSITTIMGLTPLVFSTGSGSEIQRPLAIVVLGGLISALALVLLVLPVLYVIIIGKSDR